MSALSRRETAEQYASQVHRNGRWRVVRCRNGTQFILQRHRPGKTNAGREWDSIAYCVTHSALLRLWRRSSGDDGAALLDLPQGANDLDLDLWRQGQPDPAI